VVPEGEGVRKNVTLIALLVVVLGGGFLYVFKRDAVLGLLGMARGHGPAKTPDEAVQKFQKAVKDRDYATAAEYCAGGYGEQFQRSADAMAKLGKAIDSVVYNADKRDIRLTDKARGLLLQIEPFPASFEIAEVKQQGDNQAMATLQQGNWRTKVELKPEGEGAKRSWKLVLPTPTWLRGKVDHLIDKHKDYAKALEKVSDQIKSKEITTKDDLEQKLDSELQAAAK
jgi:hypothetical protein